MNSLCSLLLILVSVTFAQTLSMSQPLPSSAALPAELAKVLTDYESAWNNNDPAALAKLFAEDGFVLANGGPVIRGRDNIEKAYSGPNKRHLSLRAIAFAAEANTGYIIGGFGDASGAPDRGKFTLTLKRDASGRWLIVSDMDNGNKPLAPPACP